MTARTTRATTTDPTDASGRPSPEAAGLRLSHLFEEHGRMVYGVCRVLLRDPEEAEDASQQTFLLAHRSLLAGTETTDPAAWLGTIARNECRSRLRSRMGSPLVLAHEPAAHLDVDQDADRRAEIDALCAALAELPHQQREAIVLREFYGLSYGEVRAALGLTESAVESLIYRARQRLQKELRPARVASGALALPLAVRDSLAHAVPGFSAGSQGLGIASRLAAAPIAAKLAMATVAVTVAGVVGTATSGHHAPAVDPRPAAQETRAPVAASRDTAKLVAAPTSSEQATHRSDAGAGAKATQDVSAREHDDSQEMRDNGPAQPVEPEEVAQAEDADKGEDTAPDDSDEAGASSDAEDQEDSGSADSQQGGGDEDDSGATARAAEDDGDG